MLVDNHITYLNSGGCNTSNCDVDAAPIVALVLVLTVPIALAEAFTKDSAIFLVVRFIYYEPRAIARPIETPGWILTVAVLAAETTSTLSPVVVTKSSIVTVPTNTPSDFTPTAPTKLGATPVRLEPSP